MVIYFFSEDKYNNRPVEKENVLCGLLVLNEANSGNIWIAFAPNTGKGTGQTHEILKNHHDINSVAQVVNRCFRVGLKKSTI